MRVSLKCMLLGFILFLSSMLTATSFTVFANDLPTSPTHVVLMPLISKDGQGITTSTPTSVNPTTTPISTSIFTPSPTPTGTDTPTPPAPTATATLHIQPVPTNTPAPVINMRLTKLEPGIYSLTGPNVLEVTYPVTLAVTTKTGLVTVIPQWLSTACASSTECSQGSVITARFSLADPLKITVNTNIPLVTDIAEWNTSGINFILTGEYPLPNQPVNTDAPVAAFNFIADHQRWWIAEQNCKSVDWDAIGLGYHQWSLEFRGVLNGGEEPCARTLEGLVDMRTSQPEFTSQPAPYDWRDKEVSCLIWIPNRYADQGLGLSIGISDSNWHNEYMPAVSISANYTGLWQKIILTQGAQDNYRDDGFDPSQIVGWKVRLEAASDSTVNANGPVFYIAQCRVD